MRYEFHDHALQSLFGITDSLQTDEASFSIRKSLISLIWNRNPEAVTIQVDGLSISLAPQQIISTTYFHKLVYPDNTLPLTALLFNREFYCISDHDSEVSCNGILFFGTQDIPLISLDSKYLKKLTLLWEVLVDEFQTRDNIQGDMLQMLLKRFIILCTRIAKEQLIVRELNDSQIETIRKFNFLVDIHFREKRKVKDYADLLFKSPKTLSNLFALYNQQSPQQIIQERVVLEAKRMMLFTDMQTQQIAYELGFDDPAHFSRYFKKVTQTTPSAFKAQTFSPPTD